MGDLGSELKALRQRHQITIMELADIKEDNNRLKKINTVLVQNLTKQECDPLTEIKLIIQGDHYRLRIVELESELEKLNMKINDQVEKRVNQIKNKINKEKQKQECENCKKECQKCHKLQLIITEKNDIIDGLRLDLEQVKADLEIITVSNNKQNSSQLKQLRKNNQILKKRLEDMHKYTIDLEEHHEQMQKIQNQWQNRYDHLNQQHQLALQQLSRLFKSKQQHFCQSDYYSSSNDMSTIRKNKKNQDKENQMKKKIQHLAGQIASRKSSVSPIKGGYCSKPNAQSRLLTDSDFSQFTIKDAINRPNQNKYF